MTPRRWRGLGESRLGEGNLTEAVANLRKAYQLENKLKLNNTRTRGLLGEALLDGLGRDFATYGPQAEEIERILDNSAQRVRNARIMAEKLRIAGQWAPGFDQLLRLMEMEGGDRVLEVAVQSWLARRDRWICGTFAELYAEANSKVRAEIDRALEDRLKVALASKSLDGLWNFVDHFDGQQVAVAAPRVDPSPDSVQAILGSRVASVARLAIVLRR